MRKASGLAQPRAGLAHDLNGLLSHNLKQDKKEVQSLLAYFSSPLSKCNSIRGFVGLSVCSWVRVSRLFR